jgi:hypothetical protein
VPKVHKEMIIKEVERLCQLGVLERQPASEWALPSFIIPKKDQTVRFLSDFWEVNKRLVRKPFPIPKINTVLQDMEGFSYVTTLDLNMSYYTIRLDPDAFAHLISPVFLRLAKRPSAQFANSQTRFYNTRTPFKHWSCYSPTSIQARVLVVQASVSAYLQDSTSRFFSYESLNARTQKNTTV